MGLGPPEEGKSFGVRWSVRRQHGLATVEVAGDLDLASIDAVSEVLDALLAEYPALVVDLEKLDFLDSTGLRMLGRLQQTAQREDKQFLLGRVSTPVRRVIHIAGLVDFFEYVEGAPAPETHCKVCDNWVPASNRRCIHCGADL